MTQKHIAIAEMMRSKGCGLFQPAFIQQELNRLNNKARQEGPCCVITRSETRQNLTTAHRHATDTLNSIHSKEIQTLETAHSAQIAHLITSHKAQITKILDKIHSQAQNITSESIKTNLGFVTQNMPSSSSETSNPNRRASCDNCGVAHVKCTKKAEDAECSRCVNLGIECVYGLCGSLMRTSGVKGTRVRDSSEQSE